jgi:hypothetical protein
VSKILFATIALSVLLYHQAMASECLCNLCSRPSTSDAEDAITCVGMRAKLESKETLKFRHLVECSIRQWQCKDGALSIDISDSMLTLMESNPQIFFDVMASHDREFDAWLQSLGDLSFVWFQEPPIPSRSQASEANSIPVSGQSQRFESRRRAA